ncbi:unnamed protein product [Paramecium sonneborni]|uniref:Uncharacterized protein n=1 Tax=Paramecium sonneborni TaxID=65129 RepID=A0A8S1REZ7_9CILI|nr:unnamed protein product [Paramecium sonneborni]
MIVFQKKLCKSLQMMDHKIRCTINWYKIRIYNCLNITITLLDKEEIKYELYNQSVKPKTDISTEIQVIIL